MEIDLGFARAVITSVLDGDCRDKKGVVFPKQIHSNIVKEALCDEKLECDGLYTKQKGMKIGVYTADCMPIFVTDNAQKIACVLHSGREGSFQNIFARSLEQMKSNPKDISVYLGPSIKSCCYEVKDDIVLKAVSLGFGFAIIAKEDKTYLDLDSIVKDSIKKAGVSLAQVASHDSCSCCDERYYSYRQNGTEKRTAAYIWKS